MFYKCNIFNKRQKPNIQLHFCWQHVQKSPTNDHSQADGTVQRRTRTELSRSQRSLQGTSTLRNRSHFTIFNCLVFSSFYCMHGESSIDT